MLDYIWQEYRDLGQEMHQAGADLRQYSRPRVQED